MFNSLDHLKQQVKSGCFLYTSDAEALSRCDEGVKLRNLMERAIVRKLVSDAFDRGFAVSYSDGESSYEQCNTVEGLMAEIQSTDEEKLRLKHPEGRSAYVYLVYGNDGYDVIADYTLSILAPFNQLMDAIEAYTDMLQGV